MGRNKEKPSPKLGGGLFSKASSFSPKNIKQLSLKKYS